MAIRILFNLIVMVINYNNIMILMCYHTHTHTHIDLFKDFYL